MSSANDPAFPEVKTNWPNASRHDTYSIGGLTKREYFAAMAMQAYIAGGFNSTFTNKELAVLSAKKADALIAELERTK